MAKSRSPEDKLQVVLPVLRGEMSGVAAATDAGVNERTERKWRQAFMEGGRDRLAAGKRSRSVREQELEAENEKLKAALGEAHMQNEELKVALGEAHMQLRQQRREAE